MGNEILTADDKALFSRPFATQTQAAKIAKGKKGETRERGEAFLGVLCVFARVISLFSRPFVALTQAAKIAKKDHVS